MKKKKKKNLLTAVLVALIVASVAAIGYVILYQKEDPITARKQTVQKKRHSERKSDPKVAAVGETSSGEEVRGQQGANEKKKKPYSAEETPVKRRAKEKTAVAKIVPPSTRIKHVAIIIDDIGYDMKALRELLDIDAQITYAVLPLLSHSREAAEAVHRSHREVLLHLPMEPRSYPKEKPGSGALFTDMSLEEITLQLEKNLASVPYAAGVNNHMGSKFMSDEEKLTTVFKQLKKHDLFFIDSRTTKESKSVPASQKVSLTVASRRVFLDNERDYDKIYRILMNVAETPAGGPPVIVIGHPYPETIRALRDARKVFREKGISIIPASKLINMKARHETS